MVNVESFVSCIAWSGILAVHILCLPGSIHWKPGHNVCMAVCPLSLTYYMNKFFFLSTYIAVWLCASYSRTLHFISTSDCQYGYVVRSKYGINIQGFYMVTHDHSQTLKSGEGKTKTDQNHPGWLFFGGKYP